MIHWWIFGCNGKIYWRELDSLDILFVWSCSDPMLTMSSFDRLSRGEDDLQSSDIHVFTSHFYTTLREDGPKSVQSWTEKKNINIFNKKMVFIPINQTLHWSLCVLIHPGAVGGPNEKRSKYPCMLFMDSLRMHDSETVEKNVYAWLNQEWDRLKKDPPGASRRGMRKSVFEPASYPCISPKGKMRPLNVNVLTHCQCRCVFSQESARCLSHSPTAEKRLRLRCFCMPICLRYLPACWYGLDIRHRLAGE